jgi:hypothetical protein
MVDGTDDETVIAFAVMLGCEFYTRYDIWYIDRKTGEAKHPLELMREKIMGQKYGWRSKIALARDFVEFVTGTPVAFPIELPIGG